MFFFLFESEDGDFMQFLILQFSCCSYYLIFYNDIFLDLNRLVKARAEGFFMFFSCLMVGHQKSELKQELILLDGVFSIKTGLGLPAFWQN